MNNNTESEKFQKLIPGYIQSRGTPIFSWYHCPPITTIQNITVIICNPMGYEYTHSHRSLKFMADKLAISGLPVFRFDFHGVGDSPGDELAGNKLSLWLADITAVINAAKTNYPDNKICLLGLRFGATLASMASSTNIIDYLILWEPIVEGRSYIRELIAISRFSPEHVETDKPYIESAGFLISSNTADEIKKIDLLKQDIRTTHGILYIFRDDNSINTRLYEKLNQEGTAITQSIQPGYAEMMAEPQDTLLPEQAIKTINLWLSQHSIRLDNPLPQREDKPPSVNFKTENTSPSYIEEHACWYDQDNFLFGVLCKPVNINRFNKQAIILINSGSVHHVGPNNVYSHLARKLAESNRISLRIDIEGIGDSCKLNSTNKNHPYQKNAVDNVFSAMHFLKKEGIANEFILIGLCSGAHTAFHLALSDKTKEFAIKEINLINPLTFYWNDDMSLDIPSEHQNIKDSMDYSRSFRNIKSWKKLFKGQASTGYIAQYILKSLIRKIKTYVKNINERVFHNRSQLAIDFLQIMMKGIKINLIFSSQDPGKKIVMSEAKIILKKGSSTGEIELDLIDGADHTFSKKSKREQLYSIFQKKYKNERENQ